MTNEIGGIVRALLAGVFGSLIAKGYLNEAQSAQIIEYVVGIAGVVGVAAWSFATNQLKAILKTAAKSPDVKKIEASPDLANKIPSSKVVPSDDLDLS